MDPQTLSFFFIIGIDTVLLLFFIVLAFFIIQCRRSARNLTKLTKENILMIQQTQKGKCIIILNFGFTSRNMVVDVLFLLTPSNQLNIYRFHIH